MVWHFKWRLNENTRRARRWLETKRKHGNRSPNTTPGVFKCHSNMRDQRSRLYGRNRLDLLAQQYGHAGIAGHDLIVVGGGLGEHVDVRAAALVAD